MMYKNLNSWWRSHAHRVAMSVLLATAAMLAMCSSGSISFADAAGKPGTAYVLDIGNRNSNATIYRIDSVTGARMGTVPAPWGDSDLPSNPDRTLISPAGLKVDADGYLIVAVADGYNESYTYPGDSSFYSCGTGCGAVLRINPDNGQTVVLTKGVYMSNPYQVLLPADNDITDNDNNYLLVADSGESQIIRVDLNGGLGSNPDSNQSVVYGAGDGNVFKPWGLARNGSQVVVVNTGLVAQQRYGFLSRFTDSGGYLTFNGRTTSGDFRHPRGLTFGLGRYFTTDPFVTNGGFGIVYGISGSQVDYVSAGDKLRTPSGIALDYKSKYLLVSDENWDSPGMIYRINTDGGAQSTFVYNVGANPIDIAVDRRSAPKPARKPKKKIRPLGAFQRDQTTNYGARDQQTGQLLGDGALRIVTLTPGARLRLLCISALCRTKLKLKAGQVLDQRVSRSFHLFDFRAEQTKRYLTGRFRVIEYADGGKLRGYRYAGVFREYVFQNGEFNRVNEGCLKPGKQAVKRSTRMSCPS